MFSLNKEFAQNFAHNWIDAWNRRDLQAILDHYAEEIEFSSPLAHKLGAGEHGQILGKQHLTRYWSQALAGISELHLSLEVVLLGTDSLTLLYDGPAGRATETMWFSPAGLVNRSFVSYSLVEPASSRLVLLACITEFKKIREMCEAAIAQLDDSSLHVRVNPHQNSIGVIMQHMAGNMISRFTDFLTSDGEKPTRNREGEFQDRQLSRPDLLKIWDRGWQTLFDALTPLTDEDLKRTVTIRKQPHSVFQAINRQTAHYACHMGQILLIGKHLLGDRWKHLTIPPGGSDVFNQSIQGR